MAHVSSSPELPETPDVLRTLALRACDGIDALHVVQLAYACLEKLIGPQGTGDAEEGCPDRIELGALVGVVNEVLQRRVEAAGEAVQLLREALSEGGARTAS